MARSPDNDEPFARLLALYRAAVQRALPLHNVVPYLPEHLTRVNAVPMGNIGAC